MKMLFGLVLALFVGSVVAENISPRLILQTQSYEEGLAIELEGYNSGCSAPGWVFMNRTHRPDLLRDERLTIWSSWLIQTPVGFGVGDNCESDYGGGVRRVYRVDSGLR